MYYTIGVIVILLASTEAFLPATGTCSTTRVRTLQMSSKQPVKGAGFNYDPSNYMDSNSGNYRRLSDQLAAKKAEEDQLRKERDELLRKEKMQEMFLRQENATFWETPDDKVIGTSDQFYVSPEIEQIITDLDKQLVGLKPVKEKMRRYATQMLVHKIRKWELALLLTSIEEYCIPTYIL